jgi:hypothetical protein
LAGICLAAIVAAGGCGSDEISLAEYVERCGSLPEDPENMYRPPPTTP